ncbi:MAG: STAS domain-containing protein [Lachnospiraceae bacterium]|nr:STAS domain-containing protein [Lachnospiraceae bacterium]
MLDIVKNQNGDELTVALKGRLDTTTAPQLESELQAALEETQSLVINLEEMQYISSAGLRVLLSAQKKMARKGGMVIRNATDEVKEIFDVTGFSDILTIE